MNTESYSKNTMMVVTSNKGHWTKVLIIKRWICDNSTRTYDEEVLEFGQYFYNDQDAESFIKSAKCKKVFNVCQKSF